MIASWPRLSRFAFPVKRPSCRSRLFFILPARYVQQKYEEAFNGNVMYPYVTNALDTSNCQRVFTAIKDNVLFKNLDQNF